MPSILSLTFSSNMTEELLTIFLMKLLFLPLLQQFTLSWHSFSRSGAFVLTANLPRLQALQTLHLDSCGLKAEDMRVLAPVLA
jgi:hypothetical protein